MALFTRTNLNMFSFLNNGYCKFTSVTLKVNKNSLLFSEIIQKKLRYGRNIIGTLSYCTYKTFDTDIIQRRNQAFRSILVQVSSANSYVDLQNYCSQFGKILSMHHYQTKKHQNYILIEFKNVTSVKEIISHASFVESDSIVPIKSSILWFRKGTSKHVNQEKMPLTSTERDISYLNKKEVLDILYKSNSVTNQIMDLYNSLKLSDLDIRLRFHAAYHLEQYFSGLFHNMKVLLFGSSINGFGWKKCDLDLVLISNDAKQQPVNSRLVFHSKPMQINEKHETKEFMGILASTMHHFVPGIKNIRKILEARVPIIKFQYEYSQFECDLSISNMCAIYISELLNLYGKIDFRVRPLVITIRKWAHSQEITSDSPGYWITNFSLSLLVIFYLQQKNILPSLNVLKKYATRGDGRYAENGVDCTFLRDIRKLPIEYKQKLNQDSLETLLFGFFEYYAKFDFFTKGICIREGIPIRKPSRSALHIVNPLEAALNVSKNVSSSELNRLTTKICDAVYILESADNEKSKNLDWGVISLLKTKNNISLKHILTLTDTVKQSISLDHAENYSHEVPDKVSQDDISQPKQKKEIV